MQCLSSGTANCARALTDGLTSKYIIQRVDYYNVKSEGNILGLILHQRNYPKTDTLHEESSWDLYLAVPACFSWSAAPSILALMR